MGKLLPECRCVKDVEWIALGSAERVVISPGMSALPPKADIGTQSRNVRFVPKADILHCSKERRYSITFSARARSDGDIAAFAAPRLDLAWD
jgi:hypothetical protein